MVKTNFLLGCNYWASHAGIYMWRNWNYETVKKDLEFLSENGISTIRVFPLWSDFQPIEMQSAGRPQIRIKDKPLGTDPLGTAGIDPCMMNRFSMLLDIAQANNIKVIVGLITGWMSGRCFVPPAISHCNVIKDSLAITWQLKFIKGFVEFFKKNTAIIAWDLGNECNVMGYNVTRSDAYAWSCSITNAIKAVDNSRPVYSGMHGLTPEGPWAIVDQGEICDVLTTHPYPLFTEFCNIDEINDQRSVLHSAAESNYYAGLGNKPCLVEEVGTLGPMVCSDLEAAKYIRRAMLSSFAYNTTGFLWWCSFDFSHSGCNFHPYDTFAVERELGLAVDNNTPKPVLKEMHAFATLMEKFPGDTLPKRDFDAVCVLTSAKNSWANAYSVFTLGVQSGIEVDFCYHDQPLKDAPLYIMPCIRDMLGMDKYQYLKLIENVKAGSTLFISYDGGIISEFKTLTGVELISRSTKSCATRFEIENEILAISKEIDARFKSIGAEILISDENGELLFSYYKLGKGEVYFLAAPLENYLARNNGVFDKGYYKLYQIFAKNILSQKIIRCSDPKVGVTLHSIEDNTKLAIIINYGNGISAPIWLKDDIKVEKVITGRLENGVAYFEADCAAFIIRTIF